MTLRYRGEHKMWVGRSPTTVTARCSCGWYSTQTRHQNALARASKIRAAQRRHLEKIEADRAAQEETRS